MWQRTTLNVILTVFGCVFAVAVCANGKTIYVDADATGANDGSSWADAHYYLQDALMFAVAGDEIRVARGSIGRMISSSAAGQISAERKHSNSSTA